MQIPPAAADRVANSLHALTDALLNLPVGDLKAAVEGRRPTSSDRHLTVGDLGRRDDPNFGRNLHRRIAEATPMVRQGIAAADSAVPPILQGLQQAAQSIDRAMANMPDPTYPRR